MHWLEDPVALAMTLPPLAVPLFVFASAFLEYVFPPYWGDTVILLGFFLAAQGAASPPWIFTAAISGSILGSIAAYQLGQRYGMAMLQKVVSRRRRATTRRRPQELFRRFGERVLLVNRFLPVVRGVMLYAAGALRMRFWPSILYCGVSNLVFISVLMSLGFLTAGSWDELLASARSANRWLALVAVVVVAFWVAGLIVWNRRSEPEEPRNE